MGELQEITIDQIANIPTDAGNIGSKQAEIYTKLANGVCSEIVMAKNHPDSVSVSQSLNREYEI